MLFFTRTSLGGIRNKGYLSKELQQPYKVGPQPLRFPTLGGSSAPCASTIAYFEYLGSTCLVTESK